MSQCQGNLANFQLILLLEKKSEKLGNFLVQRIN